MKNLIRSIGVFFGCIILLIVFGQPIDDPPKKKEVKKDTTQIDIEQLQQKNISAKQRSLILDSLIMQIDTLKKKK